MTFVCSRKSQVNVCTIMVQTNAHILKLVYIHNKIPIVSANLVAVLQGYKIQRQIRSIK
jgi:putative Ca2+/H+ antiporter (TMEM165/GDT1 family)